MRASLKRLLTISVICGILISSLSSCDSVYVQEETTAASENTAEEVTTPPSSTAEQPPENISDISYLSFSHKSGIYSDEFSLELLTDEEGEIFYTTDGSDPETSDTAVLYDSPVAITDRKGDKNVVSAVDPVLFSGNYSIADRKTNTFTNEMKPPSDDAVDKCTVVRAILKKSDGTVCKEISAAYFIGTPEEHIEGLSESCKASGTSLAVMSISMNYSDLFDSKTGIYVKGDIFDKALEEYIKENKRVRDPETARSLNANYKQKGREWEREAAITLFEFSEDGAEAVLTQNCGIRIQGNYSRSDLQKGLRLYARTEYGENNFDYAVFGEDYKNTDGEVMDKYDTLVLRNGGNCAFTAKFNDTYWQSLVEDLACSTQKSRPCVVYLNGEYWGLYVLQEDYTDDYMEDYYGVDKDKVVIYKGDAESLALGYKLDEGELPSGVDDESYYFSDLFEFFKEHDNLEAEEDYNEFVKLVDPDSVMDYFAVQSWIDNKWDWPGKNWSMWKTTSSDNENKYADGRWRLMFYDIEFGGVCGEGDARNNTIKNANYKPNGLLDMDTNNPAVLCFAYLMTNDSFSEAFCEKLSGLSETNFNKKTALEQLDKFRSIYSPLYNQFFERYEGAGTTEDAVEGGYASIKCISDFLEKREKYIQKMVDYCNKTLNK